MDMLKWVRFWPDADERIQDFQLIELKGASTALVA